MFNIFKKKKKYILLSEVLEKVKDNFITDEHHLHIHDSEYRIVGEWDINRPFFIGEKITIHEFYVKDNIHYRNSFTFTVE